MAKTQQPNYLSVRDYERLSHYSDRKLIWIKLYFDLFDDIEFCLLPDESKFHFIGLMMLATKLNNRLPNNSRFLAQRIGANKEINLKLLLEKKFLFPSKALKTKTPSASKPASTEQEQEQEQEKEQDLDKKQQQASGGNLSEFSYEENIEYFTYRKQVDPTIRSIKAIAKANLKSGKYDPDIRIWKNEQKAEIEKAAKKAENDSFSQWAADTALRVAENRELTVENLIENFGSMPSNLRSNFDNSRKQHLHSKFLSAGVGTETANGFINQLSAKLNGAPVSRA